MWVPTELTGPHLRHPDTMRSQGGVKCVASKLRKVRCQPEALKLTLSLVRDISHNAPPLKGDKLLHTMASPVGGLDHGLCSICPLRT